MIGEHPWLGIGRGAFESVFPAHELAMGRTVFTHAESFPAQWASEWGLPIALAFLAALAWFLRPANLGVTRRSYAAGAWAGVVILLLQILVDLALEIPGICIAVTVVLGSLWGEARAGGRGAARRARATPSSRFTTVAVASVGGLAILGTAYASHRLIDDRATILAAFQQAEALEPRTAREALEDPLRQMMRRHPAEPYFPLVGGLLAWRAMDQDPIPWIQRALERSRLNGRAHLLLAQVVAGRGGKSQALLELRFAMEQEPALAASAVPLALRWSRDEGELFGTVPEGASGVAVLDAFARALQAVKDRPLGERFDWAILARDADHTDAHARLAESLLRALPPRTADRCTECERAIEDHANAIASSEPGAPTATFLRIRLRLATGRVTEAEQLLSTVCTDAKHRAGCAATRAQLTAQIPGESALSSATRELVAASCATRAECARATTLAGQLHESRGELGAARSFYTRAAAEDPTEARWLDLARVASRTGAHWEAMQALERAARRRGSPDPELSRRIQEERDKAMHGVVVP
jgi:tetratricopeptide (TPR) repeat protein